ncbi:MAG: hypothetical protein AAF386_06860 [Pseudomonadota bacterium]
MKLVILCPTGGTVHTRFMASMIGLTQALQRRRIPFGLKHYEFSDLVMSRNYLVSYFLSNESYTHALMLDSDLAFDSEQFFRLLDFDKDFTAAVYADRRVTGSVLKAAMASETPQDDWTARDVSTALARHMKYVTSSSLGQKIPFSAEYEDEFMTVASAGTGFMLIRRAVVEAIVDQGQARMLDRTGQLRIYADAPRFADFFSHLTTPEGDAFYGEDQSFCRRWILGCGGKIWVDRASRVTHIGSFAFDGDFSGASGLLDD